ncbi:Protein FAR1-RELATED SEQUENCE 5 [Hordeum vulgare]|nr:Protein FAR1-RELATED SEQUENCE 5 [Hordeum vulgare]
MAPVIPDGDGDNDSDGSGGGTSLDGGGSFCEVDNWLGSTSYATQAGLQQPEAPLVQSSPMPGCSMGCRYGNIICLVRCVCRSMFSSVLVHSNGSAEAVEMEIECASEEGRALEIECACEEDRSLELTAIVKHVKNHGPTSRSHNEVEHKQIQDWFLDADEFCFAGDLGISDEEEEDEVELAYLLKKPKSNKKKMKDRV